MKKADMVKKLADDWGGIPSSQADENLTALVTFITKTVKKEKELRIPNLGTFSLKPVKARTYRNPRTGEPIRKRASKRITFSPSKAFKEGSLGPSRAAAKKATTARRAARKSAAKA